ncbi:MAG: cation:proton antiporter [Bacteroidaceae bacterium]|nr:cation:proton antiporter [Bacteroidaceae bacterium]
MEELPDLIIDLALILTAAGVVTILFKKLKQPVVLGYVVAGFLASPHMPYTPSVREVGTVDVWANIGVIFLLFALGLEFSFKKILKMGSAPVIAAVSVIFCMMSAGFLVASAFGWSSMDSLFLGGMLAMSSTTIIYKAFDDLGLRQQRFTGLVLSVLILEDILAILLMVVLSTVAVSQQFEGEQMLYSLLKLVFFLVLWFVVGLYFIPQFLKNSRAQLSNETLLIVSLGLCFALVVIASMVGFSSAFGAFMMGSILAETVVAEKVEHLIAPVKDLFGAIFFVSVGMMVDPHILVEYWIPILAITLTILLGQGVLGSCSFILAGQPLKVAMQCGFSLAQIGEFAFIIASLGVSLGVTSGHLYPIVVAVSVITTFLTPYMIRLSAPAFETVQRHLPTRWKKMLERYATGSETTTASHQGYWHQLLSSLFRNVTIYYILSVAVIMLMIYGVVPLLAKVLPGWAVPYVGCGLTLLSVAVFLRAIVMKKNHSIEFKALWEESYYNRLPLVALILVRGMLVLGTVIFVISYYFSMSIGLLLTIGIAVLVAMIASRNIKQQSINLERTFLQNLRQRDIQDEHLGRKKPLYAGHLLSRDIHMSDITVPMNSLWCGRSLMELSLGRHFGVHVSSILRGKRRLNIPNGKDVIFPGDVLQVIGSDQQLENFVKQMNAQVYQDDEDFEAHEMKLRQFVITADSIFCGKNIIESGIRDRYHCMVVGLEQDGEELRSPDLHTPLKAGDVIWLVGEAQSIRELQQVYVKAANV